MEVSTLKIAELTGLDRGTVRKYLQNVPCRKNGPGEALGNYYESSKVLSLRQLVEQDEACMLPTDRLALTRKRQIELDMQVTEKQRPKLGETLEIVQEAFDNVAGIVKGSALSEERKVDCFAALEQAIKDIRAQGVTTQEPAQDSKPVTMEDSFF